MSEQKIEGVPVGMKLVRIGRALPGDLGLNSYGETQTFPDGTESENIPILDWDNVYRQDLSTVPIPEGYERDGETPEEWFRSAKVDETFLGSLSKQAVTRTKCYVPGDLRRIIIRKIAPKTRRVLVVEFPAEAGEAMIDILARALLGKLTYSSSRIEDRPL